MVYSGRRETTLFRRITRAALLAVLAVALVAPPARAAFPGANGKITFLERVGPNAYERRSINPDGTGLAPSSALGSWSPDGRKVVYTVAEPFEECEFTLCGSVWTVNADGSGRARIPNTMTPGACMSGASWTADGTRVLYSQTACLTNSQIWTIKPDGSEKTLLADYSADELGGVSASPDGVHYSYMRGRGSPPEIFVARLDGVGEPDQLTSTPTDGRSALGGWSPDGEKILFASSRNDPNPVSCGVLCENEIYTMNADGSNHVRLTNADLDNSGPEWSPDGSKIVFTQWCVPNSECDPDLYIMSADGSNPTFLVRGCCTAWQPLNALKPYPRPGGATPLVVYFVPAYEQCTSPNSQHVTPLAQGSCEPPVQVSDLLTTSKIGQGKGSVRLDAVAGSPLTSTDEADVKLDVEISDVRRASDQSDYLGSVILSSTIRTTDRSAGFGGVSGTSSDARFDVSLSCVPTAVTPRGSDCALTTSLDALVPGMIPEGKRTILATHSFAVLDAGLDGSVSAPGCPPSCGTGDEETYLEQGTFTP